MKHRGYLTAEWYEDMSGWHCFYMRNAYDRTL